MKHLFGTKVGMTQIFEENGAIIPVTVIEVLPHTVVQKKTVEQDGYNALQLGFTDIAEHRINKPNKGHFDKAGVEPKKYLREVAVENIDAYEVGSTIGIDLFEAGDKVDVVGTSKGKGTQGVIRRHGFGRGRESHGSKFHRMPGGMSASAYPGKVFKNHRMAGKMGHERVTIQNLEIVQVNAEENYLLVKGSIPGPKKGLVEIKTTSIKR